MNIRQKITHQKNWKLKMRIALLIPLMFVIVYIVAQSGAIDMSSITGFATLGAKSNDVNDDTLPDGFSNPLGTENDDAYSIFASDASDKDIDEDQNKDKDQSDNQSVQDENSDENNDTQIQAPPVLGGGGGSSGSAPDDEPVVTPPATDLPENDTDDSTELIPSSTGGGLPPANFWGILYINDTVADIGETIIARINNTEYQTTTVVEGYYTITVPGLEGSTVELIYNGEVLETEILIYGNVQNLDLSV
ncbi:MAG: hypothetical protein KAI18_01755 [Candidatus Aenigmarchaeota archaeon]|nr:hypothetical protein [Candidatus Aenigmarchaeota archaeon]